MLEVAVFLCGAVVMVMELAASRVLAPFLGTSTVVWTSIIGVMLGAMSLGYWWGGRLADKSPKASTLALVILAASGFTALIGFSRVFIVEMIQYSGSGLHLGSLQAAVLLFAPPAALLGMVAPFAARIRLSDCAHAGRTVGRLYALSTLGSIVGTFAGGFFLISWFGSAAIQFLLAAVLVLASLLCHAGRWQAKACLAAAYVGLYLLAAVDARAYAAHNIFDVDTPYQRVLIYPSRDFTTGKSTLAMSTGPEGVQGAVYTEEPEGLALNYTRYLTLAGHFAPDFRSVLVLGGGAYAFPRYVLEHHPQASVDVVELDPGVTRLAREHFHLRDDPRMRLIQEDARTFLNANKTRYGVIVEDAFNSHASIPFHLTTVEAMRRLSDSLDDRGVLLVNSICALEGPVSRLYTSLYATLRAVFPQVHVIRVWTSGDPAAMQNILFVCFKNAEERPWTSEDEERQARLDRRIEPPSQAGALVLTDDFAPVERFITGW